MFDSSTYIDRRNELKKEVAAGIILLPGNNESPMNYSSNTYKFRQDSNFLYYFGLDNTSLCGIIDIENDTEIIFGNDLSIDDIIWMGGQNSINEKVRQCGVNNIKPANQITSFIKAALKSKRQIHFLPQYRAENLLFISSIMEIIPENVNESASKKLSQAVIKQRSIKDVEEVNQIEDALDISYEMNTLAMKMTRPGIREREIFGMVEGITLSKGHGISFPIIFSVKGEILHNHDHENIMRKGDLALLDSGAESLLHYASDITRTFPVSGKFTERQKDIYNIVLSSQLRAIGLASPGKKFKDIHLETAKVIADGLKSLGLMKGNTEDAVSNGAHALFFPHGLGHMLGLDVHDMEGLGENLVGYDEKISRSDQFGLAYLRLAKELQPGFVVTIEPGVYFIPPLIEKWKSVNKFADFIDYNKVDKYLDFGGIRIEDDILITENGYRVLGRQTIPKTLEDVEKTCQN